MSPKVFDVAAHWGTYLVPDSCDSSDSLAMPNFELAQTRVGNPIRVAYANHFE